LVTGRCAILGSLAARGPFAFHATRQRAARMPGPFLLPAAGFRRSEGVIGTGLSAARWQRCHPL